VTGLVKTEDTYRYHSVVYKVTSLVKTEDTWHSVAMKLQTWFSVQTHNIPLDIK